MLKKVSKIMLAGLLSLHTVNVLQVNATETENLMTGSTHIHPVTTTSDFTEETNEIVNEHLNDFNANNFHEKMEEYGGYEKYLTDELGGVFAKYAGGDNIADVKTASELQEIAEYVLGLMTIYGFDYCNNKPGSYSKWRSDSGVTSDAFYPRGTTNGNTGHAPYAQNDIDLICSGELTSDAIYSGLNMTVDCDLGIDRILKKAGIFKIPCYEVTAMINNGAKRIYNVKDLKVGDLVECYTQHIDKYNWPTGTFGWGGWNHVCMVGDVNREAGTITLYDTGHLFTNTGNPINVRPITVSNPNQFATDWIGIRYYDIVQDLDTGWCELPDENWIYNKSHGERAADEWLEVDEKWYHFSEEGYRQSGWYLEGTDLYYLDENGERVSGVHEVEGVQYEFDAEGKIEHFG